MAQCKCLEQVNAELAKHNTTLDLAASLDRENLTFCMDNLIIATRKIDTKQRGPTKTMIASFCPFCGKSCTKPKTKRNSRNV
jgi:hypothetical protein